MAPLFYYPGSEEAILQNSTRVDFSNFHKDSIILLGTILAWLSLLGSTFVIASYIIFSRLRSVAFELILMVAIADFLGASSCILTSKLVPTFCLGKDLFIIFSDIASMFWVWSIARMLHLVLLRDASISRWSTGRVKFQILCWGVSSLLTVLPIITNKYDINHNPGFPTFPSRGWPTIFEGRGRLCWELICWDIPVLLIWFYIIYVYSKVWRILRARPLMKGQLTDSRKPKYRFVTQTRIAVYPIACLFTIVFGRIGRVYQLTHEEAKFYSLLFPIATNLKGLLNSCVYGFTTAVRLEWMQCFCPDEELLDKYVSFNENWRTRTTKIVSSCVTVSGPHPDDQPEYFN